MNKIIQSFIGLSWFMSGFMYHKSQGSSASSSSALIKVNFLCLFSYFCFVTEKRFQIMDLYIGQNHFQRPNTANFEVCILLNHSIINHRLLIYE